MEIGDFVRRKRGKRLGCISKSGGPYIEVEWSTGKRERLLHALTVPVPFEQTGAQHPKLEIGEELYEMSKEIQTLLHCSSIAVDKKFYSFKHKAWAYRVRTNEGITAWVSEKNLCPT